MRRELTFGKLFQRANLDTRSNLSTSSEIESLNGILPVSARTNRQRGACEVRGREGEGEGAERGKEGRGKEATFRKFRSGDLVEEGRTHLLPTYDPTMRLE